MINVTEWKSCLKTKPETEGDYLVVRFRKNGSLAYATSMHYTLEYGWNTYADANKNPIVFTPDNEFDKEYFWTTMTKEEGNNE